MKQSTVIKLLILLLVLVIEYHLPFPVHLKQPDVGDMNLDVFSMSNIYLSSEESNKIAFPYSGEVERSKIPNVLMAITLPVGLYLIIRKGNKRQ
ncbi:hypothetical protein R50345_22675 [Paenibacillus sp. FSL R5-0345]|uniref:hypothetical protein n=1 Tax=Paenibacillus sp. FSL R5-0345 TaxID=1536770 RepID=UPI0004F6AB8E|nr:hypothetical protein [Paenibacillus sp. FSL R5-0345]AIQ37195.1 hypothetical protein R50345_22675 [Paenibacillus sp. FSL R5-0345]